MANATTKTAGITKNGFHAYRATHGRAPLHTLRSCYARRRAAICVALGLTLSAFNARAKAAVEALIGLGGKYADRVQAYSYVASQLEAALPAPSVVPAPAAVVELAPVALTSVAANDVTGAPLSLLQVTESKPYPGRPAARFYLPLAFRPANDATSPATPAERAHDRVAWLASSDAPARESGHGR